MGTILMLFAYVIAFGLPVPTAHAAQPNENTPITSPTIRPCVDAAGGTDVLKALRTCEGLLKSVALSDKEKSVVHGILGSGYFELAVSRIGPGVKFESLGQSLTAQAKKDIETSIRYYSFAIQSWPTPINFWNRGFAKEVLGQYKEAVADYDQVVRLQPDFLKGYLYRARVLAHLGKRDQARVDLDSALRLAPYDPEVLNARKALTGATANGK
jgi:tetratricopeptide (TPR) repeat protein